MMVLEIQKQYTMVLEIRVSQTTTKVPPTWGCRYVGVGGRRAQKAPDEPMTLHRLVVHLRDIESLTGKWPVPEPWPSRRFFDFFFCDYKPSPPNNNLKLTTNSHITRLDLFADSAAPL